MNKIFLLFILLTAAACCPDEDTAHVVSLKVDGESKNFNFKQSQDYNVTDPDGNTVAVTYFDTEEDTKTDYQDRVEFSVYKEGNYKGQVQYFRYLDQGPNLAYLASNSPDFSVTITAFGDNLVKGKFSGIIKSGDISKNIENGKIDITF